MPVQAPQVSPRAAILTAEVGMAIECETCARVTACGTARAGTDPLETLDLETVRFIMYTDMYPPTCAAPGRGDPFLGLRDPGLKLVVVVKSVDLNTDANTDARICLEVDTC